MNIEAQKLMERISGLRDDDLLRMLFIDSAQYRPEAITYAKAEMMKRAISFDPTDQIAADDSKLELPLAAVGRRIWNAIQVSAFGIGCVIGLLPFIWANYYSYNRMYDGLSNDFSSSFGFPFDLYQTEGGWGGGPYLFLDGLIADLVLAICAAVCIGWVFKWLLRRGGAKQIVE